MEFKSQGFSGSDLISQRLKQYFWLGFWCLIVLVLLATILLADSDRNNFFYSLWQAQTRYAVLWLLDVLPIIYWFACYKGLNDIVNRAEEVLDERTRDFLHKSGDLESKLRYKSDHDSLTNLPNYQLFMQRIGQSLQKLSQGDMLAVMLIKITDFKDINYKFGSFGANSLLVQYTETLKGILLDPCMLQPYMGMNMLARIQGSEFAILIPRLREEHNFTSIVETILLRAQLDFNMEGKQVKITSTLGAALYPAHGENEESLMHHASISLLHAEREGLPYAIYSTDMDDQFKTAGVLFKEISQSIEADNIHLLYSPYYDLNTHKIMGMRAMEVFGEMSNQDFSDDKTSAILEGSPIVRKLNLLLLRQVIEQRTKWQNNNIDLPITISLIEIVDLDLPEYFTKLIQQNHINPALIELRITEKACLVDQRRSLIILNKIASQGIKISIADFGTGSNSLIYLTHFPITGIKIAKHFINQALEEEKKLQLLKAVISMAEIMKLEVMAEGIENDSMLQLLRSVRCKYGEGMYFGKPMTAESIINKIQK